MTSTRLLCVAAPASAIQVPPPPVQASGANFYTSTKGGVLDIAGDATGTDVQVLLSSGYFVLLGQVGSTSERPTYPKVGQQYVDSTLSKLITYTGSDWRDVAGAAV